MIRIHSVKSFYLQCDWPALKEEPVAGQEPVYALVLADTHLLGSRNGHWMDKWRREWQMHRAFQTALTLHRPEVVFVLGMSKVLIVIYIKQIFNQKIKEQHTKSGILTDIA